MKISKTQLNQAIEEKILNSTQAEALWNFLKTQEESTLNVVNLCFYLGGLIAILSITLLLSPYIVNLGSWWMLMIFSIYLISSFASAHYFRRQNYSLPAAISLIFAIGIFPLWASTLISILFNGGDIISFLNIFTQEQLGYQIASLLFSFAIIFTYHYPLILQVILLQIWYFIYSISPNTSFASSSIQFAIICLVPAFILHFWQKERKYSYWFFFMGGLSLWLGIVFELTTLEEHIWLIFLFLNLGLLFMGLHLEQRIYLTLGGLGLVIYLSHFINLLLNKWQISWLLAFGILSIIGVLLLRLGVFIQQHQQNKKNKHNH
jgi:hypothetical protein